MSVHAWMQGIITWYFAVLERFGLVGVVILMAMESSIFPVPSELVIPPAAYLESHAKGGALLLTAAVILAGTIGSYIGAATTYWVSRAVGRPLILRYGKFCFVPPHRLRLAEAWVRRYGAAGVFFARLLPVVRHLVGIPAGLTGLRFRTFSLMTIAGSALWCTILTIFGLVMAEDMAAIYRYGLSAESPAYRAAFRNLTYATMALVGVSLLLHLAVTHHRRAHDEEIPDVE